MFNFFKKKPVEIWAHVKTIDQDVSLTNTFKSGKPDSGKIYIHLYESNLGNRKFDQASTFVDVTPEKVESFVKSSDIYHTKLVRWLAGRVDPDIPRYDQIPEEETANMLKGKVD